MPQQTSLMNVNANHQQQ